MLEGGSAENVYIRVIEFLMEKYCIEQWVAVIGNTVWS